MILEHPDDILEEMPIILELGTFIRTFYSILELLRNILENHNLKNEQPPLNQEAAHSIISYNIAQCRCK